MKYCALTVVATFLFSLGACNKSDLLAPMTIVDPNANKFSGTYAGLYEETYNGANNDSNGVFKHDTAFAYSITIFNQGPDSISIEKGIFDLNTVAVVNDSFQLIYHYHKIHGHFVNDSLYISSKALTGNWDSINPDNNWFAIQTLDFKGRKTR